MRADLDFIAEREDFKLRCAASYSEGVHLVSGIIGSGKSTMALVMASLLQCQGSYSTKGVQRTILSMQFPEYHITSSSLDDEVRSWGLDPRDVLPRAGMEGRGAIDPFKLSRGQLKRLNLACVFALDPDILLLDEPFSSLDCMVKSRVCKAIESRQDKITMVFSHERSVLPRVDSISHIADGELRYHGNTPDAVMQWSSPPPYLRKALERGARPKNIALQDSMEALCAIRD